MGAMQGVWNQKLKIEIKIKINSEDGTHAGWVDSGEEEVDWYWSRYKQQVFLSDPAIPGVRSRVVKAGFLKAVREAVA